MKINADYFNIFKEFPLFAILELQRIRFRRSKKIEGTFLIVNTCLIGEFSVSIPAIRSFIKNNPHKKIDLLVSPPIKDIAQKIIGINNVFTVKSVYKRDIEQIDTEPQYFDNYEETHVLFMSYDAYRILKKIHTGKLYLGLYALIQYSCRLLKSMALKKRPNPWGNVSFSILKQPIQTLPFNDLFTFDMSGVERITQLPQLNHDQQIIIIHTGASWIMNTWNNDNWVQLLTLLHNFHNFRFVFIGSKKEQRDFDYIQQHVKFMLSSLISQISLSELLIVFNTATYMIAIDSGPRNMAYLTNLPTLTLLGPGPHLFTPRDAQNIEIDKSHNSGLMQRFFSVNTRGFINQITPQEVFETFTEKFFKKS